MQLSEGNISGSQLGMPVLRSGLQESTVRPQVPLATPGETWAHAQRKPGISDVTSVTSQHHRLNNTLSVNNSTHQYNYSPFYSLITVTGRIVN